ncbi:hypothetical protein [uncultured Tenacibaculum sp.]|uniref:hypothetical protein n=1 Tax=uncultured Tenacibaculum sp. TaxID=174713 RepID=UPI0026205B1A|nr:hypothetical protein [uncultured Tenacibaculum sp.]
MPSFSSRKQRIQHIINEVSNEYKEASYWLPFDALEIKDIFTQEELTLFKEFIDEIQQSTNENERKAKLVNNISKYGGVIIKALELSKIV